MRPKREQDAGSGAGYSVRHSPKTISNRRLRKKKGRKHVLDAGDNLCDLNNSFSQHVVWVVLYFVLAMILEMDLMGCRLWQ